MDKLPTNETLSREIRKAMLDADLKPDQLGKRTRSVWYKKIRAPLQMNFDDYFYLCNRLRVDPDELLRRSKQ